MEVVIYIALFGISAAFLVGILTSVTSTQVREASRGEVNQQLSFVEATIERLVESSSVVENDSGVPSKTLVLRMASSSLDKTFIYASGTAVYLEEGSAGIGQGVALPITTDKVRVEQFVVTKYESEGGRAIVHADITLAYDTQNPKAAFARTWRGAISRVSAATFDSDLLPNADGTKNIGTSLSRWKDAFFSGKVVISDSLGLGASPSANYKLTSTGNIGFTSAGTGVVLKASNGTCFLLGVSNSGGLTTSTIACP